MTAFPPVPADDWWRDGDETVVYTSQTDGYAHKYHAHMYPMGVSEVSQSIRTPERRSQARRDAQNDPKTEDTP